MAKGQPCSELAARRRLARLDRATSEEMRAGLELLRVVDPVGFEVALPGAPDPDVDAEAGALGVCGQVALRVVSTRPGINVTWRSVNQGDSEDRGCRAAIECAGAALPPLNAEVSCVAVYHRAAGRSVQSRWLSRNSMIPSMARSWTSST